MIHYETGTYLLTLKNVVQRRGSIFPKAMVVALPCALLTALLRWCMNEGYVPYLEEQSMFLDSSAWSGFTFSLGFLIVFRTSQSYARFWDGCTFTHQMHAEWFDAACSAVTFTKHSRADQETIDVFKNILVRLVSMLHAAALGEVESAHDVDDGVMAFDFDLLDPQGLDEESLIVLKASDNKVELLFTWMMQLVVENIDTGVLSIPAPILSRFFQEAANGMVAFHEAIKIAHIPFPFPYAQTCDLLLILHWFAVPLVISQWVPEPAFAAFFALLPVFVMWSLNFIAVELEDPFGRDQNDIDGGDLQRLMNRDLTLLLKETTIRTPFLSEVAVPIGFNVRNSMGAMMGSQSLNEVWRSKLNSEKEVQERMEKGENIVLDINNPTRLGRRSVVEREQRNLRRSTSQASLARSASLGSLADTLGSMSPPADDDTPRSPMSPMSPMNNNKRSDSKNSEMDFKSQDGSDSSPSSPIRSSPKFAPGSSQWHTSSLHKGGILQLNGINGTSHGPGPGSPPGSPGVGNVTSGVGVMNGELLYDCGSGDGGRDHHLYTMDHAQVFPMPVPPELLRTDPKRVPC